VSQSVVKAIQDNAAIEPERLDGLSTRTIFNRLHSIFADIANGVSSSEIGLQEICDIMNSNTENKFVQTALKLGINSLGSSEETMMMFYMLHRNISFEDNEFTIDELSRLFDDPLRLNDAVYDAMRKGDSTLQEKGLIEFQCEDGLENREAFRVPQQVQDELFADLSSKGGQSRTSIPKDELISHNDIKAKKMYYNDSEGEQVRNLTELLGAEKFAQVQTRLREKGLRSGFCCLFYGPAGTGKTETVFQIARETGREVFMVDMSKLKSKWIGDSEKNIKALFNTYRNIVKDSELAPILLFNEADAIFGRRLREESSTDKMNNAIQNLILQEMESLEGVLIATTNLTENFDTAFERRFLYKILFRAPEAGVKAKIWRSMVEDLSEDDAARLAAEYGFTGGQIENISRKLDVDYILSGRTPDMDKILSLCQAESIQKQQSGKRIGF
jgi:SpoVK/Ycf46/Vps4 family AAA+-type ATPase